VSSADSDVPRLDYAPAPRLATQRRVIRRAFVWLAIIGALAAAVFYGPDTVRQAVYLRAQAECMEVTLPPAQVVYANQPSDATLLLSEGYKPVTSIIGQGSGGAPSPSMSAGYAFAPLAGVGEETLGYYSRLGGGYVRHGVGSAPVRTGAFLHRRQHPQGQERLIAIVFLERQNYPGASRNLEINALVWRPATWAPGSRLQLGGLSTLSLPEIDQRRVRIFAAQPDSADTSHFTMAYEIDGQPGMIDAWLDLYDRVRLQVRDGPAQAPAETAR
jgi:hypothetical protein